MVVIKNKHRTHPRALFLNPFFGAEYMHILDVRQDYFFASKRRENRCARRGLLEVRRPKRGRRAALGTIVGAGCVLMVIVVYALRPLLQGGT